MNNYDTISGYKSLSFLSKIGNTAFIFSKSLPTFNFIPPLFLTIVVESILLCIQEICLTSISHSFSQSLTITFIAIPITGKVLIKSIGF